MENQFTGGRVAANNFTKMTRAIKHSLRMIKVSSNQKFVRVKVNKKWEMKFNPNYQNENMFWFDDEEENNNNYSKEVRREKGKKLIDSFEDRQKEHHKRFYKNSGYSLNKKRVQSLADGVLYFSSSIVEMTKEDKQKIFEMGIKTIKNMCKELDTKLHYVTFDLDEIGNPHFQYYMDNFDSKGNALNISRDKFQGRKVQDLMNVYFKELGFIRGISKEITGNENIPNGEYQKVQDMKKDKLLELNNIENKIDDLKEELNDEWLDMIDRANLVVSEYKQLNEKDKLLKFSDNFKQYKNTKNLSRLSKEVSKNEGMIKKIKKLLDREEKELKKYQEQQRQEKNKRVEQPKKKKDNSPKQVMRPM